MLKELAEKYISENEEKIIDFIRYKAIFTDFPDKADEVITELEEVLLKGAKKGNVLMSALYAVICAYNSYDGLFKEEESIINLFENKAVDKYSEIVVELFDTVFEEYEIEDFLGWPFLKAMEYYTE